MKLTNILLVFTFLFVNNKLHAQKTEAQLLQYLQTYRGGSSQHVYPCSFIPGINVTDTVKSRLLTLLKNEWTTEEIQPAIDYYLADMHFKDVFEAKFWNGGLKEKIIDIAMQRRWYFDSTYHYVYDSVLNETKVQIERNIRGKAVPDILVKLAANIGLKEAMPLFKNDLASTAKHLYNAEIAQLALAKLGDKVLYKKILKECNYNSNLIDFDSIRYEDNSAWWNDFNSKFNKLAFLNTQESIYQLHNWLDTSKTSINQEFSSGYIDFAYSANRVLEALYQLLGKYDLVKEWRKRGTPKSPETAAAILSFKKWMIKNKGKYEIKETCPEY